MSNSGAKILNGTFVIILTTLGFWVCKCGIYHLCPFATSVFTLLRETKEWLSNTTKYDNADNITDLVQLKTGKCNQKNTLTLIKGISRS